MKYFCNNLSKEYFLRLRFHHHNLVNLPFEEKAALVPTFEWQLVPLANHIIQLRRRPEFKGVNLIADLLLPRQSHKRIRLAAHEDNPVEEEEEVTL